jgi:hypothetical protein
VSTSTAAEAKLGPGYEHRRRYSLTIAYYAAFVCLGMTNTILGPTLPGLAAHTHTHLNQISFLFTAKGFGYLIGSSQGGRFLRSSPGPWTDGRLRAAARPDPGRHAGYPRAVIAGSRAISMRNGRGCAVIVFALLSLYIARRGRSTASAWETAAAVY